jgi:hypothetical protein
MLPNHWMAFDPVTLHLLVHRLLLSKRQNEAPNHDTGCGSGNHYRADSRCQLATLVSQHGLTTTFQIVSTANSLKFSPKADLMNICCDDVELINHAQKTNCG